MIDSLSNLLFSCRHRRTSFPRRPATRDGEPPEEMYVVCLACGKRFHYDWERMRIGAPVGTSDVKRSRIRYFLTACALPVIWVIGKLVMSRTRSIPEKEQNPETKH